MPLRWRSVHEVRAAGREESARDDPHRDMLGTLHSFEE